MPLTQTQQAELEKRVPRAVFLQNVEQACKKEGLDNLLALLDQQYNKYRLVEGQLLRSSQSLAGKVPEIQKTIQMIVSLQANRMTEIQVDWMLSEGIFVKGKAKQGLQSVSLWLGANTIVELTFQEALHLLNDNLKNARSSLDQINEELAYLKDQKTTTEVNVARVYNLSISMKRQQQIVEAQKQLA